MDITAFAMHINKNTHWDLFSMRVFMFIGFACMACLL